MWREPVLWAAVLVLLVAVTAVAIFGSDQLTEPVLHSPTDADGVPTALPDGEPLAEAPAVLRDAFDRPVVLVGSVEDPLDELQLCDGQVEWEFAPTLRASVVTPEGLTVAVRGEEGGSEALFHVTCYAVWSGRGWESWASWIAEVPDHEVAVGQPEPACCRDDGFALLGREVEAPEQAAWAVQDRGPYWLAFPVDASGLVHPVWPVEGDDLAPPETVYLDVSGNRLGEGEPADEQGPTDEQDPADEQGPADEQEPAEGQDPAEEQEPAS